MNIILIEKAELTGETIDLIDHRATHIVKILHASRGDMLKIGVIDGEMGIAEIVAISVKRPHRVTLKVALDKKRSAKPPIDLILALPRPIMLRRILSQVTAQGIGHIFLINANRVEKSFWDASILDPKDYREHLLLGLEQSIDTRVPSVSLHNRFKPFIEDYFPSVADSYSHKIVADPGSPVSIKKIIRDTIGRVVYAIGPEGGWVPYEIDQFEKIDFSVCQAGNRILKVDTAAVAVHGYISALL